MLGAIIGDMVGSVYESQPIKKKEFTVFNPKNRMTDDSLLTLSVARVLLKYYPLSYSKEELKTIQNELVDDFVKTFYQHPNAGWGYLFYKWCSDNDKHLPYNSFGNGSAMRISPVAWIANSEAEVKLLAKTVSEITHNHPEGIKGAESIAMCIYWARIGKTKEEIRNLVIKNYYHEIESLNFEELVKTYQFSAICQNSCPQAIYCFLISTSLEDTIRNCVAIGGDCDTTGAMAGAIAEAYYDKDKLSDFESQFIYLQLDSDIEEQVKTFYKTINSPKFK